jgi:hypothetical protein
MSLKFYEGCIEPVDQEYHHFKMLVVTQISEQLRHIIYLFVTGLRLKFKLL